jgi:hypothetical protein
VEVWRGGLMKEEKFAGLRAIYLLPTGRDWQRPTNARRLYDWEL